MSSEHDHDKVAFITGGAQRIGLCIAETLHSAGWRIVVQYRHSELAARDLVARLNTLRPSSAVCLRADLDDLAEVSTLAQAALASFGRVDTLINNASTFYPTPVASATIKDWNQLFSSNVQAPFFLAQALTATLRAHNGSIINIVDIYAAQPLRDYSLYSMAKAALAMMTRSLALELAPAVRVNGIAPGAILKPSQGQPLSDCDEEVLRQKVPLQRSGSPQDIARTALFLAQDAPYISGQILAVDGGRSISI